MSECAVRFVVGTEEKHSLSWKMRVQARESGAEIYLMPREISNDYHISLHKSGKWHVRVGEPEAHALGFDPEELRGPTWDRPAELAAGITLAFRIFITSAAVNRTHSVSKSGSCIFIPPPGESRSVEISVWITAGDPGPDSWIGKNAMGTQLVGACPLTNGEHISVVWREVATPPPQEVPLPLAAAKRLVDEIPEQGGIAMMLWCKDGNDTPWLLVGRFDDESAERFRVRWKETEERVEGSR